MDAHFNLLDEPIPTCKRTAGCPSGKKSYRSTAEADKFLSGLGVRHRASLYTCIECGFIHAELAQKFKWDFKPDSRPGRDNGGICVFENGFLRQMGDGFIVGRFYMIEVPLPEFLSLEEIGALSNLPFEVRLVAQVGRLNVSFSIVSDDEALLSAVRKTLEYKPKTLGWTVTAAPTPKFTPMRKGESAIQYAQRNNMTTELVLRSLNEIPKE
jgi:hypothetical protein